MIPSTTLVMVDGVRVVVPDSLDLITSYVLQEQEDWFEDEIKFLRRLLEPSQKVVDIGANCGVYALSVAKAVGPSGHVWAFEPASVTARFLAEGIAANHFPHVVLEQSALSSACGTARLSLNANSELNELIRDQRSTPVSEEVPMVTLDQCLERYGWRDIDFMKMDAEGEEASILKGGVRFFDELSPLVQYEVKAGPDLHLDLVRDFAELGYDSYRLVPGLDLLVPFGAEGAPDPYLLNLFCCKRDRARQLAARGFLLVPSDREPAGQAEMPRGIARTNGDHRARGWRSTIGRLPYAVQLAGLWDEGTSAGGHADVEEAMTCYARSLETALPPSERFGALQASLDMLGSLCEREPSHMRLASLARVAGDYGARSRAVAALQQLTNVIVRDREVDTSEPFLAPGKRFDFVPPGDALGNWVLAAVLEELELRESYSSYYTGASARQRLELIRSLGFGSAEMDRRLHLLQKRFDRPAA